MLFAEASGNFRYQHQIGLVRDIIFPMLMSMNCLAQASLFHSRHEHIRSSPLHPLTRELQLRLRGVGSNTEWIAGATPYVTLMLLLLLLLLLMLLLGAVAFAVPVNFAVAVAVAVTVTFRMLGSDAVAVTVTF